MTKSYLFQSDVSAYIIPQNAEVTFSEINSVEISHTCQIEKDEMFMGILKMFIGFLIKREKNIDRVIDSFDKALKTYP